MKCCLAIEVEKLRTISSVEKLDYTPVLSWQLAGFEEPAGWEAVLTDGAPEAAAEEEDEASDSEVAVVGAEPPPSDEPELRLRAAPPDFTGPASTTGKEALCTWRGQTTPTERSTPAISAASTSTTSAPSATAARRTRCAGGATTGLALRRAEQ